jgi:hypothetical protein
VAFRRPQLAFGATSLCAALLLGFLLRTGWIAAFAGRPAFDARTYFELAKKLAVDGEYSHAGLPTAYYPVGYPGALSAFMLAFGQGLTSAWVLNLLAGVGALVCIHHIALQMGLGRPVAVWAVLLGAINPVCITYSSLVITETWFVLLMLLAIAVGMAPHASRVRLVASGAILGCATLTRPLGMMLPLMLAFGVVWQRGGMSLACRRALWIGVGVVLVMMPWWARNAAAFDAFVPVSTNGGVNLYIGNNPRANGRYQFEGPEHAALGPEFQQDWRGGRREIERDRSAQRHAVQYMLAHPQRTAALWPSKLFFMYLPDLTALTWNVAPPSRVSRALLPSVPLLIAVHEFVLLVLAVSGVFQLRRRFRRAQEPWALAPAILLPGAIVVGLSLTSLLYFGMPRFHYPIFPWLELYAAAAIGARARVRDEKTQFDSPQSTPPRSAG